MKHILTVLILSQVAWSATLTVGVGQTYSTIQAAVTASACGDTISIIDGTYAGFHVSSPHASCTVSNPLTIHGASLSTIVNSPDGSGHGIYINKIDYVILDTIKVQNVANNLHYGILVTEAQHVTIQNSDVSAYSTGILTGFAYYVLIQNNTIHDAGATGAGHCIYVGNSAQADDSPTVRNNQIYNCTGAGIQFNGDCETLNSAGQTDGVISGALAEGNIIHDATGDPFSLIDLQSSIIRNNLTYHNHLVSSSGGIKIATQDPAYDGTQFVPGACAAYSNGSSNNLIVNNTIIENNGSVAAIRTVVGTGNVIFNNFLVSDASGGRSCAMDYNGQACDGSDGNFYSAGLGLTTTAAATGYFTNYAGNNFTLTSSRPGSTTYQSLNAPKIDLLGNTRPISTVYDIGAYQYNSTSAGSDTTAPTAPTSVSGSASPYTAAVTWSGATDNREILGYYLLRNGVVVGISLLPALSDATITPGSTYSYTVKTFDGVRNISSVSSSTYTVTIPGITGCVNTSGGASWVNGQIPGQVGTFTWETDVTPFGSPNDGIIGLSLNSASDFSSLGVLIRFAGTSVDVRNGAAYQADSTVNWVSGTAMHIRAIINVLTHTYDVYVTPYGSSEVQIASGYAFRSEQSAVTRLSYMSASDDMGYLAACNSKINSILLRDYTLIQVSPRATGTYYAVGGNGSGVPVLDRPNVVLLSSNRTLSSFDNGTLFYSTSSSPFTVTIPSGLGSSFGVTFIQQGTGQINFSGAQSFNGATHTAGQWASASIQCVQANTCLLWGQIR